MIFIGLNPEFDTRAKVGQLQNILVGMVDGVTLSIQYTAKNNRWPFLNRSKE